MLWRCDPTWVMASSFLRFLDHTQRRTTVGRTPLDEWSARRRDLYLTTHNTHNRQSFMPPVGFEPTISAGERPQTYALDHAATGIGFMQFYSAIIKFFTNGLTSEEDNQCIFATVVENSPKTTRPQGAYDSPQSWSGTTLANYFQLFNVFDVLQLAATYQNNLVALRTSHMVLTLYDLRENIQRYSVLQKKKTKNFN